MNKLEQAELAMAEMMRAAANARENAYSPYSHFRVGAAVLATSGRIYTGCNVENASFGLTICAERVAVTTAVAAGEREIVAITIMSDGQVDPCGACLQVIQEFAGKEPPIVVTASMDGNYVMRSLAECLPYAFKEFKGEEQEVSS